MMDGGKKEEAGPSHGGATWDKRKEEEEGGNEEDDHHQDPPAAATSFVPGPLLSLKDQIEKDKEDESLRRWKEKLLGCLESDLDGQMEPEVKFHSVGILSSDFGEINTPLPIKEEQSNSVLFVLREGSKYRLKLTFCVLHNIVSGLTYTNIVWKCVQPFVQLDGFMSEACLSHCQPGEAFHLGWCHAFSGSLVVPVKVPILPSKAATLSTSQSFKSLLKI